jgi:hypothetical protein
MENAKGRKKRERPWLFGLTRQNGLGLDLYPGPSHRPAVWSGEHFNTTAHAAFLAEQTPSLIIADAGSPIVT